MSDAVNIKLNKLLSQTDRIIEGIGSQTELTILRGYKKALRDIEQQLEDMLSKYNGNPTITELRKFKRLDALEKQITDIIGKMQRTEINLITSRTKDILLESFDRTGFAIKTATGINFDFGRVPEQSIDFVLRYNRWSDRLKQHNAKLVTDILDENEKYLRTNASQEVASGLVQGKSYGQVISSIKDRFDVTSGRAKMITYDQMHAGHMAGRNDGINKALSSAKRLGLKAKKVWKHNGAKEPRPDHILMGSESYEGHYADENGIFTLPDGTKTEAPGLTGEARHDIACHCSTFFQLEMFKGNKA
jgi:hypothetical protein